MTVITVQSYQKYIGNGVTKTFSVPFSYVDKELVVFKGETFETYTKGVDFSVEDSYITFNTPIADGEVIYITRDVLLRQLVDFIDGADFPASDYEYSLDHITHALQELSMWVKQAWRSPLGTDPIEVIDELFEEVNARITTETSRAVAEEQRIEAKLDGETARAKAEENRIDAKLDGEISRATSKENILQSEIQANTHAVEEERARAIAKESELQSNIYEVSQSIPTKTSDLINDSLQDKLIAGENITIIDNVISSQGGSGGGEERITLATTWQEVTALYLAGKSMVLDDESNHLYRLTDVNKNDDRYYFLFQTLVGEDATTWTIYTNGYWEQHIRYLASKDLVNTKQDIIPDLATIRSNAQAVTTKQDIIPDIDSIRSQVAVNTQRIEDMIVNEFPNAIPVGFPTIQDSFVSGFSAEDYMQFPFTDISRGLPFDIYFSFTTDEDVTTQQNILDSHFGIALAILNGKGVMALSSNGTSWDIGTSTGTNVLLPNTTYYAKFSWSGTEYTTALSLNDTTYVPDMQLASNLSPYKTSIYIGGSPNIFGTGSSHPFKGIINFMGARVYLPTAQQNVWVGMGDIGLASRANVSLSNLDAMGIKVINDIIESRTYDGSVE